MANPTNAEALTAWDLNASFWDQHMGYEGNDYYRIVELPSLERTAAVKPGDRALDLATGNGLVARWLASKGARVIATDGSQAMIDHAKQRSTNANGENVNSISYQILDAPSTQSFENFIAKETAEEGPFDIVVMNMAIMDIATLEPLAAALPKLLKQNTGRFVATLLHPLITAGSTRVLEYGDSRETGREEEHVSLKITTYLHSPAPMKAEAIKGQPFYQDEDHWLLNIDTRGNCPMYFSALDILRQTEIRSPVKSGRTQRVALCVDPLTGRFNYRSSKQARWSLLVLGRTSMDSINGATLKASTARPVAAPAKTER
ncbi:predicted protein [Histoplasma mississippiense (nom. inval.)]|uniref:predicted protein n=1 Tax=Ajellomyces capsulatus (strain NAm1 / WU24) TaxID=2059318 RepID=UPI000157D2AC|nr:predicted protein [Histoplasma mississippiense (nom. inval.)]EDN04430.1 predicted protein [Histoplasma mississippiense (nom. inval.)]